MTWKERDRALANRSRVFYLPEIVAAPGYPGRELIAVNQGPDREPAVYARWARTLPELSRGLTATLPWRRVK